MFHPPILWEKKGRTKECFINYFHVDGENQPVTRTQKLIFRKTDQVIQRQYYYNKQYYNLQIVSGNPTRNSVTEQQIYFCHVFKHL